MSSADLGEAEAAAVLAVLRGGTLSMGLFLDRFEAAFAEYIGASDAVAVSSGTAGLHLAVIAAGIGEGDEVVTSPFSFVASANCVLFERARVIFADIDEENLTIDPAAVARAVTPRTRAVIPVHIFGQPAALDEIGAVAEASGLTVIEDACEAIGSEYRGRRVGTFGKSAVFSFYPNKQMTTGEGAMVTTNDPAVASLLRSLRNQGREQAGAWLNHERLGYNYRMPELSAALGLAQLERLEEILQRREEVARQYRSHCDGIDGIRLIAPAPATSRLSWFTAVLRLDPAIDRDRLIGRLAARGIPTRAYFSPLHLQPLYRRLYGHAPGDFPVAERVARSTLALPFHTRLREDDVAEICSVVAEEL
jgi:perosamine synthetase